MTISNERRAYAPIIEVEDETGATFLDLDVLNAAYEGMHEQSMSCTSFTVTDSEVSQPDAIAYRFYGDERLWWVICTFNGIVDPYTELTAGTKLLIPRLDEVVLFLTRDDSLRSTSASNRVGTSGEI